MALQDPRGTGNNTWILVGGQQRQLEEYGGLDQESWMMLQSLKDLRTEIGAQEDQVALIGHLKLRLQGNVDSLKDEVAVVRADAKRLRSRNLEMERELAEKRYLYVTTEDSLKLAQNDLVAMEKYLTELGEKCQAAHATLEETGNDHAKLEQMYEQKQQQMRSFYSKCDASKQLSEIETRLRYIAQNPQHEPLMNELSDLERYCDDLRVKAAGKAESILSRLSPSARQNYEGILSSENSDEYLEACIVQLSLLGAGIGPGGGAGQGAGRGDAGGR